LPPLIALSKAFDGWLGHHYRAMTALHDFYHRIKSDNSLLLVTGDLTANGHDQQFAMANQFLMQRNLGQQLGLGCQDWVRLSVPGNHDQWPGTNKICGKPTVGLDATFNTPFPIVANPLRLANGQTIQFISVDSDADVGISSMARGLARGSFASQLIALDKALPVCGPNETRVLIVHHSIIPQVTAQRRNLAILDIDSNTATVLESFIVDHNISIVLSGHRHVARLSLAKLGSGVEKKDVLEARCGTTLQLDQYSSHVRRAIGADRHLPPNTLMVHKVFDRDGRPYWSSQIYRRSKRNQFLSKTGHDASLFPNDLYAEIALS